jgi:hypothetical protein
MEKEKSLSSIARLALIAAGGAAAVVTFTGGVTSLESAAHPAGTTEVRDIAAVQRDAGTPAAGQAAQRYVAHLLSLQVQDLPIQYTQELPFTLIFSQVPPFSQIA